ncbi:MAG: hypothetical protein IID13_10630 [Candidatus Marinimicrobia bacterium]|nr:hypothetical protein [Candidatus Neomarinimicrobiota bacterium]
MEQLADTIAAESTGGELIELPADTAAVDTTAIEPEEQAQEQPQPTAPVTEPTATPADSAAGELDGALETGIRDTTEGETTGAEPTIEDTSTTE